MAEEEKIKNSPGSRQSLYPFLSPPSPVHSDSQSEATTMEEERGGTDTGAPVPTGGEREAQQSTKNTLSLPPLFSCSSSPPLSHNLDDDVEE